MNAITLHAGLAGLAVLVTAALTTACNQEDAAAVQERTDAVPVEFSLGTQASCMSATRTAYSGFVVDSHERIDWVENDLIQIIAAQNGTSDPFHVVNTSDYTVTQVQSTGRYSNGRLTAQTDPLVWGEGAHNFYAVYPSPTVTGSQITPVEGNDPDVNLLYLNDVPDGQPIGWKAVIPTEQSVTWDGDEGKPDMRCAYMVAMKGNAMPGEIVPLYFQPIISTFQFTVTNGSSGDMTLSKAVLRSTTAPLSGTLLAIWTGDAPTTTLDGSISDEDILVVPSRKESATDKSVTVLLGDKVLAAGESCTFTAFTIPAGDYDDPDTPAHENAAPITNLTLEIFANGTSKTLALNDGAAPLAFRRFAKNDITGIQIPAMSAPTGPDIFTLPDGKHIRFTKGNLQYNAGVWSIAEHQWDYVGRNNASWDGNTYVSGTIDTFGWSSKTCDPGNEWGINKPADPSYEGASAYGTVYDNDDFNDWGQNVQDGKTYRTLTREEWIYLAGLTTDVYVASGEMISTYWTAQDYYDHGLWRENVDELRGHAFLSDYGIDGLVILPNGWECPDGINFKPGNDDSMVIMNENMYNAAQWALMEESGAIFLPTNDYDGGYTGESNCYWSSTVEDYEYVNDISSSISSYNHLPTAFCVCFYCVPWEVCLSKMLRMPRNGGLNGWAVRLVEVLD